MKIAKTGVSHTENSSKFPSPWVVDIVRKVYPAGCRVELVRLDDPYSKLIPGERGTVELVDDTGTVFIHWDNGSTLGVVYGVDGIKRL